MVGRTLGHYEIIEPLGAGGMGEVYRARDTTLKRDVAIKVLPEDLSADVERLARLEREAQLLAALNHPNIATIYGLEETEAEDGTFVRYLVLELIEGESLAETLSRGRIEVDTALGIGRQIAEALEAAHAKGIIHRDLKPANIKITPDELVKVLDFGLAKAYEAEPREGEMSPDITESPTVADATRTGIILGTAAYMSPEQARGKPLDKRTDIWSFGCVLYEMLSGQKAFAGETVSDHIAKILQSEPDWDALPKATPVSVRTLLRRCLAKDPKRRMHDMGDVWLEIEEVPEEEAREEEARERLARAPAAPWKRALPWVVATVAAAVAVILAIWPWGAAPERPVTRLSLPTRPLALGTHPCSSIMELSPDGSMMAYVSGDGSIGQIYLQRLDSYEPVAVEGAELARAPFFSPDGEWLGFEAENKLWKVPVEGGKARPICEASMVHGAAWGEGGAIIFGTGEGFALSRVSADGGEPEVLVEVDRSQGEVWLSYPEILPNGEDVLITVRGGDAQDSKVDLFSMRTGERRTVLEGGSNTRYVSSGHLVYAVDGSLIAVPFDADRGEVVGNPEPLIDGVLMGFPMESNFAHFTVAENGTLAYVSGPVISTTTSLVRVDRTGSWTPIGESTNKVQGPRFSPDGRRIAVSAKHEVDEEEHIWVRDLERDTFTRLTFERSSWWPVWTPDGQRIVTPSEEPGPIAALYWMPADGSSPPERLIHHNEYPQQALDWSPDGRTLILQQAMHPETGGDVLVFRPGEDDEPRAILSEPYEEFLADLSPDGRWLAYTSDETGRDEVYVRSFPDLGDKWQISTDGGAEPVWSPDGTELFYRNDEGRRTMVVDIVSEPSFSPGRPRLLFTGDFVAHMWFGRNYDIAPDGQSFVMVEQDLEGVEESEVRVILNWTEELKRRVPRER